MKITVEAAKVVTPELLDGMNALLPQLSSSAAPLLMSDLETLLESDAVTLLIARRAGQIVGTLTLIIFPIPTGLRAWIEDVVVSDDNRGFGIGGALTTAAVDIASSRGCRTVDLTSRPSRESANALYQRLGFTLRDTNVYRFVVTEAVPKDS